MASLIFFGVVFIFLSTQSPPGSRKTYPAKLIRSGSILTGKALLLCRIAFAGYQSALQLAKAAICVSADATMRPGLEADKRKSNLQIVIASRTVKYREAPVTEAIRPGPSCGTSNMPHPKGCGIVFAISSGFRDPRVMIKPDPNEFAKVVLWRLAGIEAAVIQIEVATCSLMAQKRGDDPNVAFERWNQKKVSMRNEFYQEALRAANIHQDDPPSETRPGQ
jgi:hypothetical protein